LALIEGLGNFVFNEGFLSPLFLENIMNLPIDISARNTALATSKSPIQSLNQIIKI
jgi:hypothetical protein